MHPHCIIISCSRYPHDSGNPNSQYHAYLPPYQYTVSTSYTSFHQSPSDSSIMSLQFTPLSRPAALVTIAVQKIRFCRSYNAANPLSSDHNPPKCINCAHREQPHGGRLVACTRLSTVISAACRNDIWMPYRPGFRFHTMALIPSTRYSAKP